MEATTLRRSHWVERLQEIEWGAVSTWLLGFGLVAYLGLKGGGYDPLTHDQIGIAVWWIVVAGLLAGAFPRRRMRPTGWASLIILAMFVAWTALSLIWTESLDKTSADLARVATYLGVFALALFVREPKGGRRMVAAVGTGIAFVSIVGLLSRLQPDWFSEATQTASFLPATQERLSYPVDYWNALAALIAIGSPLVLQVATCAKSLAFRAAAAAAFPAMALAAFFTLSRGGLAAGVLAIAVFMVLTSNRLPKLITLLLVGGGSAILMIAAAQRGALQEGLLNQAAHSQGNEMLAMTLLVCAGVGLIHVGVSLAARHGTRPAWASISSHRSRVLLLTGLALALIVAIVINAPSRTANAWNDFKEVENGHSGTKRLTSIAGQGRYQLWSSAVEEGRSEPMTGTGSGSFEYWWARNGDIRSIADDTHSLYLQTLGELGGIGLILIMLFLGTIAIGGTRVLSYASKGARPQLAAALAGCTAFCAAATFDWVWQIPVLPVAFLLLGSVLVGASRLRPQPGPGISGRTRVMFSLLGLAAIIAIAIPLASTSLVRQSQAAARAGDISGALSAARTAQNIQPGTAGPRLQQALLLEADGRLALAIKQADAAVEREPTNWRTWLVLSRLRAKLGLPASALDAFRQARALNPHSPLFKGS